MNIYKIHETVMEGDSFNANETLYKSGMRNTSYYTNRCVKKQRVSGEKLPSVAWKGRCGGSCGDSLKHTEFPSKFEVTLTQSNFLL